MCGNLNRTKKNTSPEKNQLLLVISVNLEIQLQAIQMEIFLPIICIGNSTVSRGIWDKYREWYFKIHQNITSRRGGEWYLGSFEISRAGIYPKYPEETVLCPVYTTRQRNFALYLTGVIFTCQYFKFGLNTTGLSQSHFRNLSARSIIWEIAWNNKLFSRTL